MFALGIVAEASYGAQARAIRDYYNNLDHNHISFKEGDYINVSIYLTFKLEPNFFYWFVFCVNFNGKCLWLEILTDAENPQKHITLINFLTEKSMGFEKCV